MHFLQKYKLHLGFFLIVILFFSKCYHFDPEIDDFNESIIPTLSEFRDFYIKNKDTIYGKDVSELKIISLCNIPINLKSKISRELMSQHGDHSIKGEIFEYEGIKDDEKYCGVTMFDFKYKASKQSN